MGTNTSGEDRWKPFALHGVIGQSSRRPSRLSHWASHRLLQNRGDLYSPLRMLPRNVRDAGGGELKRSGGEMA